MTEKIKVDIKNKNSTLQCSPNILKLIREKFSIKNPNYQSRKFADRIYAITPSGAFQTGIWYEIEGFIRSLKIPVEVEISDEFKKHFTPSTGITEISKIPGFTYYDYQEDTLKEFLTTGRGISILATGAGKCFGKGTEILLFDGSIKKVEDIVVGDLLIGPDSLPREVTSLARGIDDMYRVSNVGETQGRVEPYIVNSKHILSFKIVNMGDLRWKIGNGYNSRPRRITINNSVYFSGDIVNISVDEYLKLSKYTKHVMKAWKPSQITWNSEKENDEYIENNLPAYFIGAWLGDGSSDGPSITTMDDEIRNYIYDISNKFGLKVRISSKPNNKSSIYHITSGRNGGIFRNPIRNRMNALHILRNKHIPTQYLYSSRKNRLELLAGLIDTDGNLNKNKKGDIKGYELTFKNKELADNTVYLCRSLGLNATARPTVKSSQTGTEGLYYRMNISGNISEIPCKIPYKQCPDYIPFYNPCLQGIKVEKLEVGEYFGFEVSGPDRLFLLKDFTVTHNSVIQAGLCKTFLEHHPEYKILISVPNTYLLNQLYDSFIDEFGITSVTKWGDKNVPDLSKNIIIANNQILVSDIKATLSVVQNFDVVIVDEVHRIGDKKTQIGKVIHNIPTPRKFGLTGTLPDDNMTMWNVIGKIGPIIYEKNSYDIRKKGAITDIEVNVIVCNHQTKPVFSRITNEPTEKYNQELDYIMNLSSRNEVVRKIVHSLSGNILVMVDRIEYGNTLLDILKKDGKKVFFIQGDTPIEERNRITTLMENETGIVCIAMSTIFSTGVSVKNLHYAVFTYIGKSTVKIVQSIGRTVRKHETKNKAIIFDIADNLPYSFKHLKERLGIYKDQRIEYKTTTIKI